MPMLRTVLLLGVLFLGACRSATDEGEPCGVPPYFTVLPVALSDLNLITVVGGLGAPGHTLPTAHAGIYLARPGVTVRSPGLIEVTKLRRTSYLVSPIRQGQSDYSVEYRVCRDVTGWFGHVTTLSSSIPEDDLDWRECKTYSTSDETVQQCVAAPDNLSLDAGEVMGTAGMSANVLGLDVGLLDARVNHVYVSPQRFPYATFHAICPWEQYDAASQAALFSKLFDPTRPQTPASGTPRCGTMQVDVAGSAKGVWAEQGVTGQVAGDERRYITLADFPYRPQELLALSVGPTTLGATVAHVPRLTSGRVNRAFEHLTPDGAIHCYGPGGINNASSWFIAVTSATSLSIERVTHASSAGPCLADPTTWAFSTARVLMVR